MKRSKTLSLLLMGSVTLGASACGTDRADENMYTFTSLEECVTSAIFSEAECRQFAKDAFASTPRFSSREDCEANFGAGACDSVPAGKDNAVAATESGASGGTMVRQDSGSSWMPMMMGFMAGRFMSGGGMMQGSQGLYPDPGNPGGGGRSFRTATGDTVKAAPGGRVSNPSPRITRSMSHTAKPVTGRTGSVRSGGFSGGTGFGGAAS